MSVDGSDQQRGKMILKAERRHLRKNKILEKETG